MGGFGAVIFMFLLNQTSSFFLGYLVGYVASSPPGEGEPRILDLSTVNWLILPFIPAIWAMFSGLLVYSLAPEAEGHGTDAVIESFHKKKGYIRGRVPIIKTIASVFTIGSGGSAGREGPIAQMGAGFGSWLASALNLSDHDRRIMLMSGAAAGIGSIFKAPLGGEPFLP